MTRQAQARRARYAAGTALAAAMLAVGVAGLVMSGGGPASGRPSASTVRAPAGVAASLPWPSAARPAALPTELTVPAIGVRTRLVKLGLAGDGALQVPASFDLAGWYDRGPRPGMTGPAIIAGHVDSTVGPAVFYRLADLRPGDLIYIRRADGSLVVFRVTGTHLYAKDRFPSAAVYGPSPWPQLRLITCGGTFDPARHSYLSNVVVYAAEVA